MTSVFFTYPLEVIRVRMAFQTGAQHHPVSFLGAFRQIYNEQPAVSHHLQHTQPNTAPTYLSRFPPLKFYRGFLVTVMGMVPYAGVSFLIWDILRARFLPHKEDHASATPLADLAFGAISGAVAQTASYPFEVIRRRMQVGGITQPDRWLHLGETVKAVWRSRGWKGFYVGLSIGYLKVVPMTAVSFTAWQGGKRLLDV